MVITMTPEEVIKNLVNAITWTVDAHKLSSATVDYDRQSELIAEALAAIERIRAEDRLDVIKRLGVDPDHNFRKEETEDGGYYVIPVEKYVAELQSKLENNQ